MRKVNKQKKNTHKESIGYQGNVTITIKQGDKVLNTITGHNSGTYRLFQFITDCLISDYSPNGSPKYLRLFHVDDESQEDESLVGKTPKTDLIPVSSLSSESNAQDNSSTAGFTFTVSGNSLINIDSEKPNLLALYSIRDSAIGSELATYWVGNALSDVTNETNIIVVWKLVISNK